VPCLCLQQVLKHICLPRAQVKAKVQAFLEANPWYYKPDAPFEDQLAQNLPLDVMLKISSFPIHVVESDAGNAAEFADSGATGSPGSIARAPVVSPVERGSPQLPDGNAVCPHTSLSGSVQSWQMTRRKRFHQFGCMERLQRSRPSAKVSFVINAARHVVIHGEQSHSAW
jgi:hypothetical protein